MKMTTRSMAYPAMVLLYTVVSVFLTGCGATVYETVASQSAASPVSGTVADAGEGEASGSGILTGTEEKKLVVYVCGAVRHAGVYELPAGSRVYDAICAAGGLTEDADATGVNQAEYLKDSQQITAPYLRETVEGGSTAEGDTGGRININTAGPEELMKLRGIGASRAADIIAYREAHGPFESIEDIMLVSGIKTAAFEKIRDEITV